MFENTVQIVGSQFITIQTQDTAYKLLIFWFPGQIWFCCHWKCRKKYTNVQ